MKTKRMIRSVWALLLSIVLLIPIMPVFAEEAGALSAEQLNNEALMTYQVLITGPTEIIIPSTGGSAVVQKYTVKGEFKIGNMGWNDALRPAHLDAESFSINGVSWNNGQDELTVDVNASEGTVILKGWFIPLFRNPNDENSKVWGTLTVNIVRAESIPTRIELSGPSDIDVPLYGTPTADFGYTAVVYDQYGAVMDLPVNIFAQGHEGKNIDFSNGTATLHNITLPGDFTVLAQLGELAGTDAVDQLHPQMTVHVHKQLSHPSRIEIDGANSINVPQNDTDVTEVYTVKVYDQYGIEMADLDTTIFANNPTGTNFVSQTGSLTVTKDAKHTYFLMYAFLGNFAPSELAQAMTQMQTSEYIYLIKTPVATIDDANNLILIDPDFDEGLEYRIVNADPDEPAIETTGRRFEGWLDYNSEEPPTFPGKVDVELRYEANLQVRTGATGLQTESDYPKGYQAGPAITLNFTVLKPSIAINPVSPVTSTTVTITYNELQPGLQLPEPVPSDVFAGEWTSPYGVHYNLTKEMFYKTSLAGEWVLYANPFVITQNSTIYAKTVVTIEPSELQDECYDPVDLTGVYTSDEAILPIVFRVIPPPEEEEEEPVVVPVVEPVVIAPVEVPLAPLAEPVVEAPVNPLADFAFLDGDVIADEVVPQGALNEDVVIPVEVVPLGDALPKTNELPLQLFYGLGAIISGLGVYLKRKG